MKVSHSIVGEIIATASLPTGLEEEEVVSINLFTIDIIYIGL